MPMPCPNLNFHPFYPLPLIIVSYASWVAIPTVMTFGTELLLLKLSSTQGTWREDGEPVAEIDGKGWGRNGRDGRELQRESQLPVMLGCETPRNKSLSFTTCDRNTNVSIVLKMITWWTHLFKFLITSNKVKRAKQNSCKVLHQVWGWTWALRWISFTDSSSVVLIKGNEYLL